MEFPEGMTVAQGRFTLRTLLRGEPLEGLWSAAEGARDTAAWVTLRHLRASRDRNRILRFSSYGIQAPLYIGAPDIEANSATTTSASSTRRPPAPRWRARDACPSTRVHSSVWRCVM